MKKKDGSIIEGTVIFLITFIMLIVIFAIDINILQSQSEIISDDIISSELAAYKHIDKLELGASEGIDIVIITDHGSSFETFKEYLKINLGLDDYFNPISEYNFIKGNVDILSFKIYNVKGNDIEIISYESNSVTIKNEVNSKGLITTPKGNIVENTTIHAEIGFNIKPMFLNEKYITKSEETDILVSGEGE